MELKEILLAYRQEINLKWSYALHTHYGERYSQEPFEEVLAINLEAIDANQAAVAERDFSGLDKFIERIARKRFAGGFTLSDVQMAFEHYRTITLPILTKELPAQELLPALERLNHCLAYTIIKFSDYFQSLHEKALREHAQNLEEEVVKRTKELSESEAKYRVLVEEINDGYFVARNGKIIFANSAFCDMHGYALPEVVHQPYLNFVAPEYVSRVTGCYEKARNQESESEQYTYRRLCKEGRSFPTETRVKHIWYEGDYAWAGICRDITEREKMAERIRESEKLAHIGQLTASLAHEIRNPLSSIKMSIGMLLKSGNFDGDNQKTLEISAREISKLERILTEMLDFARPVKLRFEPCSINELISSCLDILKVTIREKEITVIEKLAKRVSPVLMDGEKIEQAVINILLNAIEVLPPGGVLSIATRSRRLDHRLFISVEFSDNGPGVTPEDLPYIFDPFFSKKKKGTGLGLANVKKVVDAHGGKIAASASPKGFSLSVLIPVRKNHG